MKILLVEDDPGIIHSLTEFLTGEGFSITSLPGQAGKSAKTGRNVCKDRQTSEKTE